MARTKLPDLGQNQIADLKQQLEWKKELGFQVSPKRGPCMGLQGDDARWIVVVELTDLFAVTVRDDSKGYFFLDTGRRGEGARPYCGTQDVNEAIAFAEAYLEGQRSNVKNPEVLVQIEEQEEGATLRQVQGLLPMTPLRQASSYKKYERAVAVAIEILGGDTPVSRIGENALRNAIDERMKGVPSLGLGPVMKKTAVGTFKDLKTAVRQCNKVQDEVRPIPPCHLTAEETSWPRYREKRREPAKQEAYDLLMYQFVYTDLESGDEVVLPPPVDVVDSTGMLRLFLAIAYHTGRRLDAIRNLTWEDIVTDKHDVRDLLHRCDVASRDWVKNFPHGVINFKREFDKENNWFAPPICDSLHAEIELYRSRTQQPSGPLFPSPVDPSTPTSEQTLRRAPYRKRSAKNDGTRVRNVQIGLYEEAVLTLARYIEESGGDPADVLPVTVRQPDEDPTGLLDIDAVFYRWKILKGYKLHRWRGHFATWMEKLGYGAARDEKGNEGAKMDGHPSYIASWVTHDGSVRESRYVQLDPKLIWLCANEWAYWEAKPEAAKPDIERRDQRRQRHAEYHGLAEAD